MDNSALADFVIARLREEDVSPEQQAWNVATIQRVNAIVEAPTLWPRRVWKAAEGEIWEKAAEYADHPDYAWGHIVTLRLQ